MASIHDSLLSRIDKILFKNIRITTHLPRVTGVERLAGPFAEERAESGAPWNVLPRSYLGAARRRAAHLHFRHRRYPFAVRVLLLLLLRRVLCKEGEKRGKKKKKKKRNNRTAKKSHLKNFFRNAIEEGNNSLKGEKRGKKVRRGKSECRNLRD